MHKRAIDASTAALLALFLVASPVLADTEHAGTDSPIDWRLVVIVTVLGLFAFGAALRGTKRGG
jgi:hypothetical protein